MVTKPKNWITLRSPLKFYVNPYYEWNLIKNTMCETNVIPEKEVISNKKIEKEKQFKQEEEPITVNSA